jgi:hypothetical protein
MVSSITVRIEWHYGARRIYPVCHEAHLFADIAGTKTLSDYTIERIKNLGYEVDVQRNEPVKL